MKGIILAGGSGTRLYPLTMVTSKQLLPIYDKPMIYYPMSVLMNAGIRDILIISTPQDTPRFEELLGDGHQFGVHLTYRVQPSPDGLAQAFLIGDSFIGDDCVAMILGDNIFAGQGLNKRLRNAVKTRRAAEAPRSSATTWMIRSASASWSLTTNGKAISIEEKPRASQEQLLRHGSVFLRQPGGGVRQKPEAQSARGELEITDLNRIYLEKRQPERGAARSGLYLAGHGHPRKPGGRHQLCQNHGSPSAPEDRLPGGDCLL